ncbi:MAG: DUF4412 domain-containing protein [Balneolaceae bacterium]|nr:DUF4412 domain-containing protein [Balneolaceae bacterium]
MNTRRILPVLLALILALPALPALAQFQGTITFDSYQIEDGERRDADTFTLHLTPERILLQGEYSYDSNMPFKTEGMLVRLDFEDFVFLTGNDMALTITKDDLTSFMTMFSGEAASMQQQAEEADERIDYERTGEMRQIQGYSCEKFVFRDRENPNQHTEIWMTDGLDINWGMLAESWLDSPSMLGGSDLSFTPVFQEGFFPMRIDHFGEDGKVSVTEVRSIDQSSVARAMVEIPSGVQVLSLQDFLFQQMNGN